MNYSQLKSTALAVLAASLCGTSASAACAPGEQTFMSCAIDGRSEVLRVCFTETDVFYRFGAPNEVPDLALVSKVADVEYRPWPGVGRSIWETVRFQNDDYAYEVYAGFDRMFGDETEADHPTPSFGGVRALRADMVLQELECRRDTVDYAWGEGLYDAKRALGLDWNDVDLRWQPATD